MIFRTPIASTAALAALFTSTLFAQPNLVQLAQPSTPSQQSTPLGRVIPGRFIVAYHNGVTSSAEQMAHSHGGRLVKVQSNLGMGIVEINSADSEAARRQLASDPSVDFVVQDRLVSANSITVASSAPAVTTGPADSLYTSQQGWAVHQVGGFGLPTDPTAVNGPWKLTKGEGVRIAILDSGVDASHPDIAPNLAFNLSEVDKNALPSACDDGSPQDQQGHGTWTASLAAGALGPATGLVAGAAPGASILNIKVLERMPATLSASDPTGCIQGQAAGLLSWVIQGINDAVAQHANIVSMSLGTMVDITTGDGAGLKATFDRATHAASLAGVILVAAAGNDGFNFSNQRYIELPAQARDVIPVVASTNPNCAESLTPGAACASGPITLPYYSNFGAPLNALAAPGGSYPSGPSADPNAPTGWIVGACASATSTSYGCFNLANSAYVQAMGTSASTPLAAGAIALVLAAHPSWDAPTVIQAVRDSAIAVGGVPVPVINVAGAVMQDVHNNHILASTTAR